MQLLHASAGACINDCRAEEECDSATCACKPKPKQEEKQKQNVSCSGNADGNNYDAETMTCRDDCDKSRNFICNSATCTCMQQTEGEPTYHTTCVARKCVNVTGVGLNECDNDAMCEMAANVSSGTVRHTVCLGLTCINITGSGENECETDQCCIEKFGEQMD